MDIDKYNEKLKLKLSHIKLLEMISKEKGKFYCEKHNTYFEKNIYHCPNSKGCQQCSKESFKQKRSANDINDIIKDFNIKHNNFYSYPQQEIQSVTDKIEIICPIHGLFIQQANVHKNGSGCPECKKSKLRESNSYSFTKWKKILSKIHNDKYEYFDEYEDKKMKIVCPHHGIFWQNPSIHKMGHGCPHCAKDSSVITKPLTTKEWIKRAKLKWGNKWNYSKVDYKNTKDKIEIICNEHGSFWQSPNDHLNGCGCPNCIKKYSVAEKKINDYILSLGIKTNTNNRSLINPLEVDILIEKYKLAIEYNGLYWHSAIESEDKEKRLKHLNKTNLLKEKGYSIFHICEKDWIDNSDLIKSMINYKLGIIKNKIFARKCQIKELNNKEYMQFCNTNHIQKYKPSKIKIGLFYKGDLVSIMSFSKHKKYEWEMDRYCSKHNTVVVGGVSKLFKYFIKTNKPEQIMSYANLDHSEGSIYYKLGFHNDGITKPNYFWVKGLNTLSRNKTQKKNLHKIIDNYDESKTEAKNMFDNGYRRYWNCGNIRFLWKKEG